MTNNKSDISTKIVQNGKETTADTAPETSWVPKNPPPAGRTGRACPAGGQHNAGHLPDYCGDIFLCLSLPAEF